MPVELVGATGVAGRATAHVRRALANREVETLDERGVGGELLLSPQSVEIIKFGDPGSGREDVPMRDPIILLVHLIATLARLGPRRPAVCRG